MKRCRYRTLPGHCSAWCRHIPITGLGHARAGRLLFDKRAGHVSVLICASFEATVLLPQFESARADFFFQCGFAHFRHSIELPCAEPVRTIVARRGELAQYRPATPRKDCGDSCPAATSGTNNGALLMTGARDSHGVRRNEMRANYAFMYIIP